MSSALCVRCGRIQETKDVRRIVFRNGRIAERGTCVVCGAATSKIVKEAG